MRAELDDTVDTAARLAMGLKAAADVARKAPKARVNFMVRWYDDDDECGPPPPTSSNINNTRWCEWCGGGVRVEGGRWKWKG